MLINAKDLSACAMEICKTRQEVSKGLKLSVPDFFEDIHKKALKKFSNEEFPVFFDEMIHLCNYSVVWFSILQCIPSISKKTKEVSEKGEKTVEFPTLFGGTLKEKCPNMKFPSEVAEVEHLGADLFR
jgi:hypothetical protein